MYLLIILLVISFVIVPIILIAIFIGIKKEGSVEDKGINSRSSETTEKKQYNARTKVVFLGRDRDFLSNGINALETEFISDEEQRFLEYFKQSLFFDNTRIEDCIALKLLMEKYLNHSDDYFNVQFLKHAIDVLDEKFLCNN